MSLLRELRGCLFIILMSIAGQLTYLATMQNKAHRALLSANCSKTNAASLSSLEMALRLSLNISNTSRGDLK
jgi:hypothetical protein